MRTLAGLLGAFLFCALFLGAVLYASHLGEQHRCHRLAPDSGAYRTYCLP